MKTLPKKITIKYDPSCEMQEILIDGKYYAQGNDWDMREEFWKTLIKEEFGVEIVEKRYKYKD